MNQCYVVVVFSLVKRTCIEKKSKFENKFKEKSLYRDWVRSDRVAPGQHMQL